MIRRPARAARVTVTALACTVGLLAISGCTTTADGASSTASAAAAADRATTPVTRGDLVDGKRVPGTLGYGIPVPLTSAGSGTVTWLPGYGDTIGRDGTLYSVDEVPVRSMHGTVPLWRTLEQGLRGADVDQLKDNLRALGYDVADDDRFDAATQRAVLRWQKDRSLPRTGTLGASEIAFVPGDIRVDAAKGRVGDAAGEAVYGYTSTTLLASASVAPRDLVRFPAGGAVQVELPDGTQVPGTVQSVGAPSGDDESDDGDEVVVQVRLDAAPPEGVSTSSTVTLVVAGEKREGVLSVPVTALVADADGYAVEVVRSDGTSEEVPVSTGFFAEGRVEVSGDGIAEGTEVVVPS